MKTSFVVILIALSLQSCSSKDKAKTENETKTQKDTPVENKSQTNFDLANITFSESIKDASATSGTNLLENPSQEKTLLGYERVESTSAKVLIFDGADLSGTDAAGTNKAIIHYSESDQKLALYELRVYTPKSNAALVSLINKKEGKPALERSMKDDGTGTNFKQFVWSKGDIIYLLLQEIAADASVKTSNLAVFKNTNKDLYTLLGQKGYAIDPKALIEEALKKG